MTDKIVTAAIAVVPSLIVVLIEHCFSMQREKRAAKERLLYNFLPQRLEFYGKVNKFAAEQILNGVFSEDSRLCEIKEEAEKIAKEINELSLGAVQFGSMDTANELVNLSCIILYIQTLEIESESLENKAVKELCVSVKSHLQELQMLARKENHSEEIESFMQDIFEKHKKLFKNADVIQKKKHLKKSH